MKNLALFDFDGTITYKDTTNEFFKFILSKRSFFFIKYIITLPHFLLYKINLINSASLKRIRYKKYLYNFTQDDIEKLSDEFFKIKLLGLIKNSALNEIYWHLSQNNDVIIVSASIDILLKKWCESKKVGLITNKLEVINNKFSGNFIFPDCNGIEKVKRIKKVVKFSDYKIIYAYGDTVKDLPMLDLADKKYYKYFK